MNFSDRLRSIQRQNKSLLCVGLDPDLSKIPLALRTDPHSIITFNREIIKATQDLVCAYKLNLAFYEALGEAGWSVVHRTLSFIPGNIVTIGDAKRGDIGNTAELYAKSLLDDYGFMATTVSPYMGADSVAPFISREDRGAFVLAVTSNPGARDLQYLKVKGKPVYEHVIARVKKWNVLQNCGLVVGATKPRELKRVRSLAPGMPLLIPGIGAQGGDLKSAVRYGCDENGEMALINASRSIMYASGGSDFADAARREASKLRDAINSYREEFF
ncbi:MAG: orotidine-5'-phosphate decarboxylase [Bacteroidota bacterium]